MYYWLLVVYYYVSAFIQGCSPKKEVGGQSGGRQTLDYFKRQ